MSERIELKTGDTQLTLPSSFTTITLPNGVHICLSFNEDDDSGIIEVISSAGSRMEIAHSDEGRVSLSQVCPASRNQPKDLPQKS